MSTTRRSALGILLALAVAVPAIANRGGALEDPSPVTEAIPPEPGRIRAEGRLVARPGAELVLGAEIEGTIARVAAEDAIVRAGEAVAEISSEEPRALLDEARACAAEADARAAYLERELVSMRSASSAMAALSVVKTSHEHEAALARQEGSRASVRRAEAVLRKTTIVAPFAGVVLFRHAQPGEVVLPGTRILTIADLERTWVEAEVDEFDASRVRVGASVEVVVEGARGASWRARVEEVPAVVVPRHVRPQDPGRPTDARVLLVKCVLLEPVPFKLGQRVEVFVTAR
jgi:multidrug efflux pump subunit AcrA (membrane-fusion protein)